MPRIIALSDTHGLHADLKVPESDVLVYAGDWSSFRGSIEETVSFLRWLNRQPCRIPILIGGNHDIPAQYSLTFDALLSTHAPRVTYLRDSGAEVMGLKIWGSPYAPTVGRGWAFMADRGEAIRAHWDLIPSDIQVLITHAPPHGYLDTVESVYHWSTEPTVIKEHVGCEELTRTLSRLKDLRASIHGHLHLDGGKSLVLNRLDHAPLTIVNAAMVDEAYGLCREPIVIDL